MFVFFFLFTKKEDGKLGVESNRNQSNTHLTQTVSYSSVTAVRTHIICHIGRPLDDPFPKRNITHYV